LCFRAVVIERSDLSFVIISLLSGLLAMSLTIICPETLNVFLFIREFLLGFYSGIWFSSLNEDNSYYSLIRSRYSFLSRGLRAFGIFLS